MSQIRYHDLLFQPDMMTAVRDDGETIRLTRQERALLLRLTRQPNLLVTRSQLLDGLGDEAGTVGERNIDYLVNRLRKRLGDDARNPRFIATQYGEGYVWLADPVRQTAQPSAFLLVGPVYGLAPGDAAALVLFEHLAVALRGRMKGRAVAVLPHWRPQGGGAPDIAYNIEVATHRDGGVLHLAIVLRSTPSQAVLERLRLILPAGGSAMRDIDALADRLVARLWAHAALPEPGGPLPGSNPAHVRLHDASAMLTGGAVSWRESEARIEAARAAAPDDPQFKVMLALNRYTRLVQNIAEIATAPLGLAEWNTLEDEMEALALSALPDSGVDPILLLGIAKALFFINRGHDAVAAELTERAFHAGTAFSAVFAMQGQLAAARGQVDRALDYYEKASELGERNSQFHIYLLTLRAIALLAAERRRALDQALSELMLISPASAAALAPFFVSRRARSLPEHLDHFFARVGPQTGGHMLFHLDRTAARHFESATHRRNVLSGFAHHLVRHHGPGALPAALSTPLRPASPPEPEKAQPLPAG